MTIVDRKQATNEFSREMGNAIASVITEHRDMFPTCLNCVYYAEAQAWCCRFGGYPPPRVVVYTCGEGYVDKDAIPF